MQNNETSYAGQRRPDAAFTMTEVAIAVVLMVLALGMLLSGFVSSKRSVGLAQTHLTAMQIARSEAERLQTNVFTDIVSASTVLTNTLIVYTVSNSVVTTNISKKIKIRVSWIAPVSSTSQALTNYIAICNRD